jgi:hypothetical protein
MSAFALTRKVRALARLEGWAASTFPVILRGAPKTARTSSDNGEAVVRG